MTHERWIRGGVWGLCLVAGVAIGISGFSAESNHPTYLPPSLNYLDPTFLAKDWWLASASHYHFAFFALAAVLAKFGILESGLACLNVLAVAGAIYACFRIMALIRCKSILSALTVLIAMFLMTRTFFSVGDSYLFTPSLQPSSIAATVTLFAILSFLAGRLTRCGLLLGVAGIFHVNFLVVNIPFFGLAYLLMVAQERPLRWNVQKRTLFELLKILGPSLLMCATFLPLILSVEGDDISQSAAAKADWIFFRFAVPFHYYPLDYLPQLFTFFYWQMLGLLWTVRAVPDASQRRAVWAVQLAFGVVIWSATALTTFVFLAPVSRLFLWRLAPFAVLFSVLLTIVGTMRSICSEPRAPAPTRMDSIILLVSIAALPFLALPGDRLVGQALSSWGLAPGAAVLAGMFLLVALRWWAGIGLAWNRYVTGSVQVGVIVLAVATQPGDGVRSRYSLILPSQTMRDEAALFAFVRRSTPRDAQFLVPPDLEYFRLEGERAIIVDFKGVPINRSSLIEWYRRLAAISGVQQPSNMDEVAFGFDNIDAARLESLRCAFGVTYVVLESDQTIQPPDWAEVFRNGSYRVMAYRGG